MATTTFEIAYKKIKDKHPYLTLLEFTGLEEAAKFLDSKYGEFVAVNFRNVLRGTKCHPERSKANRKRKFEETCLKKYGVKNPQQNKDIQNKTKQTNIEKYGTISPAQNKDIMDKIAKTNIKRYGSKTPAENNEVKEKIKKTNLERYGVEYSIKNDRVADKIKKTNLERYGTEYPIQNENVYNKAKKTLFNNYGVNHNSQSDEIKEKKKKTNLEKYGVEYTLQSDVIRDKIKKTNLEKYGVQNPMQSDMIKNKVKNTNIKRYGVENVFQLNEIKLKIKKILLEKYGNEHPSKVESVKDKIRATNIENGNWHNINGKSLYEYYSASDLEVAYITLNRNYNKYGDCALDVDHYTNLVGRSKIADLWLEFIEKELGRNISREYKVPNTKYLTDGYDHKTNTLYEFYGDFWHGNLDKFAAEDINPITKTSYQKLYDKTIERQVTLQNLGYNMVYIWESDFIT